MKARTLNALRTTVLMQALAVVMSVTLVTGQFLKCCRVQEALKASITHVLHVLAPHDSHSHPMDGHVEGAPHPRCHSHASTAHSQVSTAHSQAATYPGSMDGMRWQAEDPCRMGSAFVPTGLPSSSSDLSVQLPRSTPFRMDERILAVIRIDKPRPENRSSPPVYLLTLRLLV